MPITVTTDLIDVNLSEATTNYATLGTFATAIAASDDTYVQSSKTVGGRVSANTAWAHTTIPTTTVDLSINERHVFQWLKCISIPQLDSKINGGLGITISSDATPTLTGTTPSNGPTNSKTWYVGGNEDTLSGWTCFVVNPNSTPDLTLGTPNVTAIRRIGIRAKVVGVVGAFTVRPVNILFDATRYGTGLTYNGINGTTPGTFADILVTAMNTANAWGILTADSSIYFGAAKMDFGTTGQTAISSFKENGQLFVWRNFPVASTFYAWRIRGTASFNTTFQLGDYSNGLVSNGCTIKGAGIVSGTSFAQWTLDIGINTIVNIYGSQLSEMRAAILQATTTIRGCTFKNFGNITANGAIIDNCTFQDLRTTTPISATYGIVAETTVPTLTNNTFVNCAPAIKWNVNANTNGKLDGCKFVSGVTGYAIELGPNCPSAITFVNINFSGYGAIGTTNAAVYNNSGKAVTISISGGTSPTYYNGIGASTVVDLTTILTLTGLQTGSDIVILNAGTSTEQVNVDSNSGTTYAYSYSDSGQSVDIGVFKSGYIPFYIRNYTLPATNSSLPINQIADRNYKNL